MSTLSGEGVDHDDRSEVTLPKQFLIYQYSVLYTKLVYPIYQNILTI